MSDVSWKPFKMVFFHFLEKTWSFLVSSNNDIIRYDLHRGGGTWAQGIQSFPLISAEWWRNLGLWLKKKILVHLGFSTNPTKFQYWWKSKYERSLINLYTQVSTLIQPTATWRWIDLQILLYLKWVSFLGKQHSQSQVKAESESFNSRVSERVNPWQWNEEDVLSPNGFSNQKEGIKPTDLHIPLLLTNLFSNGSMMTKFTTFWLKSYTFIPLCIPLAPNF